MPYCVDYAQRRNSNGDGKEIESMDLGNDFYFSLFLMQIIFSKLLLFICK